MAKYVIISGSPRKGNSDTIAEFIKGSLDGEVELFDIKSKDITFCQADNACKVKDECVYKDDAYDLIKMLEECDGAFFIAPVYFGRLPGMVAAVIDRFYSKFNPAKGIPMPDVNKKIGLILTYGGGEDDYTPVAEQTAFAFGVLGFGSHKNVLVGDNNDPEAFASKDDQKAAVKDLVDWVIE